MIRTWPNGPGTIGKAPSAVAYKADNPDEDMEDVEWGFNTNGLKAYLWTKLLLGKDSHTLELDDPGFRDLYGQGFCTVPAGKGAKDVVTDYLRGLYKYFMNELQNRGEVVKVTPIEFWVTVPAIWTDAAKTATFDAARAAGFGERAMDTVNIITEPEAAALTILKPRVGLGTVTDLEASSPGWTS